MIRPGNSTRRSSSTETTWNEASLKITAGVDGDRRNRPTASSTCAESIGTIVLRVASAARNAVSLGVRIDTRYPGRFSAMISPLRS